VAEPAIVRVGATFAFAFAGYAVMLGVGHEPVEELQFRTKIWLSLTGSRPAR
jgi:hypothetical protein